MRKILQLFVLIFGVFTVTQLYGQSQKSANRFLKWTVKDPIGIVNDLNAQTLLTTATFGAGVAMISLGDGSTSRNFQANYRHSKLLDFTNRWGDINLAAPFSAGIFATSLLTNNTKFQDAAFTSLQSLLMANLTVNAGKFLFARERPSHNEGPYDLDFLETGATSFPSGHTATAFAIVTPWLMYYPGPITYTLMAIPVGTAIARVAKGRHWLSDVTAGAGIGVAMGYYLSKKHLQIQSERIEIMPVSSGNGFSLKVNFSF